MNKHEKRRSHDIGWMNSRERDPIVSHMTLSLSLNKSRDLAKPINISCLLKPDILEYLVNSINQYK